MDVILLSLLTIKSGEWTVQNNTEKINFVDSVCDILLLPSAILELYDKTVNIHARVNDEKLPRETKGTIALDLTQLQLIYKI